MRANNCVRLALACGLAAIAPARGSRADEPAPAARSKEMQQRLDRQIRESIGRLRLWSGPDPGSAMTAQTVQRWVNDPRGTPGQSTLVLWTEGGRPGALTSIYPWRGNLSFEFVSLSAGDRVVAKEDGNTVWSPATPGVTFRDLPDAPAPADSPAARLSQMKALAGRFKAIMTGWNDENSDRAALRMLPKPIYRYELGDVKPARPDLIDGAVFAFVLGTDPEAVLVLEAAPGHGPARWRYTFGRATYGGVEARLDSTVVWTAAKGYSRDSPAESMTSFSRPLGD